MECPLPDNQFWTHDFQGQTKLLAVITPCTTGGKDATKERTVYDHTTTDIVTDLRAVECVVGRVYSRGKWAIIDRSGDFQRTEFISTNAELEWDLGLEDERASLE